MATQPPAPMPPAQPGLLDRLKLPPLLRWFVEWDKGLRWLLWVAGAIGGYFIGNTKGHFFAYALVALFVLLFGALLTVLAAHRPITARARHHLPHACDRIIRKGYRQWSLCMSITLHADPVPLRVDETGTIRVGESRVGLDVVLQYWRSGMSPEEIAKGLDSLTLADIHGALAYYLRHPSEVDKYLRAREQEAEQLRQQIEGADAGRLSKLMAKLESVRAKENHGHAATSDG